MSIVTFCFPVCILGYRGAFSIVKRRRLPFLCPYVYGQNVYLLPNSYVEALTSHVMVFGGGASGRQLDLNEALSLGPLDEISPYKKRDTRALCILTT